jgi:hypothetical protein
MKSFETPQSNHLSHTAAIAVVDAVMRATGILLLMGIAVIHLVQLVPTIRSTPLLGLAFIPLIAGSVIVGAQLVNPNVALTRLWLPVLALGLAAIVGYVFTRVVSTPFDNQDVGNWSCMLGIAALFVEGTLVALSAYAVSVLPRRHEALNGVAALSETSRSENSLVRVGQTNGSRS